MLNVTNSPIHGGVRVLRNGWFVRMRFTGRLLIECLVQIKSQPNHQYGDGHIAGNDQSPAQRGSFFSDCRFGSALYHHKRGGQDGDHTDQDN